ncbi:hypothetical protein BDQ17DRAFT_1188697, partial [Cyathus striatus]
ERQRRDSRTGGSPPDRRPPSRSSSYVAHPPTLPTSPTTYAPGGPGPQPVPYNSDRQRRTSISVGYPSSPRNVRWNDNLICPSPVPCSRRKGWYNRRGDQLWTNEGAYKPAAPSYEYPPDLDDYPEYGQGWMNEEGTRIDMGHRLIPKAPLRSALKQKVV